MSGINSYRKLSISEIFKTKICHFENLSFRKFVISEICHFGNLSSIYNMPIFDLKKEFNIFKNAKNQTLGFFFFIHNSFKINKYPILIDDHFQNLSNHPTMKIATFHHSTTQPSNPNHPTIPPSHSNYPNIQPFKKYHNKPSFTILNDDLFLNLSNYPQPSYNVENENLLRKLAKFVIQLSLIHQNRIFIIPEIPI